MTLLLVLVALLGFSGFAHAQRRGGQDKSGQGAMGGL